MSNFSSLKNVPPVLQKLTPEKAWKTLRDPFAIAILASLGVHGLLWFGLPFLPASTDKPSDQRTLNVIELSPLEQQARLPQSSALLQPIPPRSSSSSNSATTGMPSVPVDSALPDPNPYYQIPDTFSSSQSTTTTTRSSTRSTTKTQREKTQKPTETAETQTEDETTSDQAAANLEASKGANGEPLNKGREDQEKLAALQQSFAFNATGTSQQDLTNNLGAAANTIAEKFNVQNWEGKPLSVTVPFPKEACQFQHEGKPVQGTTGLAIVMLPDGTLGDNALMVKSSGFKGLDEAAVKFVEKQWNEIAQQNKIEASNRPKAFVLELKIAPTTEGCSGTQKPAA